MDQILRTLSNYVISVLLFVFGFAFLVKYAIADSVESQPLGMLISALVLIAISVLVSPYVMDRLEPKHHKVVLGLGVLGALGLAGAVYGSIDDEIEFQKVKERVNAETVQRLTDIRDAQKAYAIINGAYTNDFDTLKAFIIAPVMPVKFNIGSFHDTLPETASYEGGYVLKQSDVPGVAVELSLAPDVFLGLIQDDLSPYKVRDTLYTSYFAENFTAEKRAAKKLPSVSMDSLAFNPWTGERFFIDTGYIAASGFDQSVLEVRDPTPFGRDKVKKDTLIFGSLTEAHIDGNWRQ
jgi:hypothetical protein